MKILPDEIVTYTGKIIKPLSPDPEKIDIVDIAHSLSNQCRFTGHTREFYSTAQHSVLVSEITDYDDALWGLLHDASEAYLSDIARPIKNTGSFGDIYRKAEAKLEIAVALRFGLIEPLEGPISSVGMPPTVKWADDVLLRSEMRDLMPEVIRTDGWYSSGEFLDTEIDPWEPGVSEQMFLLRFYDLRR